MLCQKRSKTIVLPLRLHPEGTLYNENNEILLLAESHEKQMQLYRDLFM